MDETLALPSEHAVTLAVRTQQVLAYETGVTNTVDPLGGSYFVESLTRQMQSEARAYFERIERSGGMIAALESGFFRREIAEASFAEQREVEAKRKIIVGVNAFQEPEQIPIELLNVDHSVEPEQIAALRRVKELRGQDDVPPVAQRRPPRGLGPSQPAAAALGRRQRPRDGRGSHERAGGCAGQVRRGCEVVAGNR